MCLKNTFGPSVHIKVGMIQKITISNIRLHVFEPPKNLQISENLKLQILSTDIILFSFQNVLYPKKYCLHVCLDVVVFPDPLLLYFKKLNMQKLDQSCCTERETLF